MKIEWTSLPGALYHADWVLQRVSQPNSRIRWQLRHGPDLIEEYPSLARAIDQANALINKHLEQEKLAANPPKEEEEPA